MRDTQPGALALPAGFWSSVDVRRALAARDMGKLFDLATAKTGISQVRLGVAVIMSQGRISNMINGKDNGVKELAVFERIATGMSMPDDARAVLGLAPERAAARPVIPEPRNSPDSAEPDRAFLLASTRYADSTARAVTAITRLWRADIDQAQALIAAPIEPAAWNAAAFAWLVAHPDKGLPEPRTGPAVGLPDVARVREAIRLFDQLDGKFGGVHTRRALIQYLKDDATALLRGTYTSEVGRDLYAAVSEAALLAAWSSYDAGLHGIAQRYFIQALRLAESANDRRLAASVLSAMSHQANFVGHHDEAADLARAAQTGITATPSPALTAQFQAMEARALARPGDTRSCELALSATERSFEHASAGTDPEFIAYFDEAELSAEFAHSFRDLGQPARAIEYATRALAASDGSYPRSDFFVTMVLADAYADQNEPEQACQTALSALRVGESLTSARCDRYLREFRHRLARFDGNPAIRDLTEQATSYAMWARTD